MMTKLAWVLQAEATPASGQRINFRFDNAAFLLKFWPYRVPYPVPFRLLGDEAKGWLDTTMAQLAQRRQVVFVVLENDGFEAYRAIKAKAQQHGVRLGWEPWMKGEPIYFWGQGGRSLTVQ